MWLEGREEAVKGGKHKPEDGLGCRGFDGSRERHWDEVSKPRQDDAHVTSDAPVPPTIDCSLYSSSAWWSCPPPGAHLARIDAEGFRRGRGKC